jgi:hypothetical protein
MEQGNAVLVALTIRNLPFAGNIIAILLASAAEIFRCALPHFNL